MVLTRTNEAHMEDPFVIGLFVLSTPGCQPGFSRTKKKFLSLLAFIRFFARSVANTSVPCSRALGSLLSGIPSVIAFRSDLRVILRL